MTLLVLVAQLFVFAFIGLFGSELLVAEPGLRAATQLVFVAPLAAWAFVRLRGTRSRLDGVIVLALAALAVVGVTSVDRQGSLDSLGLAISYALAFWCMREVGGHERLRTALAIAVSVAFTLWLVMAMIFWILEKVHWTAVTGAPPPLESAQVFIWGTTNAFPIMSLLALPFIAWQRPGPPRAVLLWIWVVASAVVIPFSVGRAAWFAFAIALVVYGWLSGWFRLGRVLSYGRRARFAVPIVVVAGVVIALTAGTVLGWDRLVASAGGDRLRIWSQAIAVFLAHPLTGAGPTTFSWIRLTYVPDFVYPVPVRLSHDVALQTLADGGVLLGGAFAALLVTFLAAARQQVRDARRRLSLAVLVGLAAASLLDDFSSLPALMVAAVTLAAWIMSPRPTERAASPARDWMLPVAVGALALLAAPAVVATDVARIAAADARAAAVAGDWDAAAGHFSDAAGAYSANAGYWLGLGLVSWHAGDSAAATAAYETAHRLSPGDGRAAGALAALSDDPPAAEAYLEEAARHAITDPQFAYRLGDLRWSMGDRGGAVDAYGLAVAIDPGLIATFGRASGPSKGEVATAATDEAARLDALDGYVLRFEVPLDLALDAGRDVPPNAPLPWRVAARIRDGDAAGATTLAEQGLRRASDIKTIQAAVAAAEASCDADRTTELASLVADVRPIRPSEVRDVRDHTYRDQSLGTYQPLARDPYPRVPPWPASVIPSIGETCR